MIYAETNIYSDLEWEITINIKKFIGKLPNPLYIEGYIFLKINNQDFELRDTTQYLWMILINGILEIEKGHNEVFEGFPEQAVPIIYKMSEDRSIIEFIVGEGRNERRASIDYQDFVKGICYFAKDFFNELVRIEPSMEHENDYYLEYIDALEKKYGSYNFIYAKSYLEVDRLTVNSRYIPIEEFKGELYDPSWIEGEIALQINSQKIEMYDLVDVLWAYLINGILEIEKGENYFRCYFPDAYVPIIYKMNESRSIIEITIGEDRDEKKASIDYQDFVKGICYFAKEFYHELIRIEPSMEHKNDSYLEDIDKLEEKHGFYKNTEFKFKEPDDPKKSELYKEITIAYSDFSKEALDEIIRLEISIEQGSKDYFDFIEIIDKQYWRKMTSEFKLFYKKKSLEEDYNYYKTLIRAIVASSKDNIEALIEIEPLLKYENEYYLNVINKLEQKYGVYKENT